MNKSWGLLVVSLLVMNLVMSLVYPAVLPAKVVGMGSVSVNKSALHPIGIDGSGGTEVIPPVNIGRPIVVHVPTSDPNGSDKTSDDDCDYSLTIPLRVGNNYVSVPLINDRPRPGVMDADVLFPGNDGVYRYNPDTGEYEEVDRVRPGEGLVVKSPVDTHVRLCGRPVETYCFPVKMNEWNLIGSSTEPLDVDNAHVHLHPETYIIIQEIRGHTRITPTQIIPGRSYMVFPYSTEARRGEESYLCFDETDETEPSCPHGYTLLHVGDCLSSGGDISLCLDDVSSSTDEHNRHPGVFTAYGSDWSESYLAYPGETYVETPFGVYIIDVNRTVQGYSDSYEWACVRYTPVEEDPCPDGYHLLHIDDCISSEGSVLCLDDVGTATGEDGLHPGIFTVSSGDWSDQYQVYPGEVRIISTPSGGYLIDVNRTVPGYSQYSKWACVRYTPAEEGCPEGYSILHVGESLVSDGVEVQLEDVGVATDESNRHPAILGVHDGEYSDTVQVYPGESETVMTGSHQVDISVYFTVPGYSLSSKYACVRMNVEDVHHKRLCLTDIGYDHPGKAILEHDGWRYVVGEGETVSIEGHEFTVTEIAQGTTLYTKYVKYSTPDMSGRLSIGETVDVPGIGSVTLLDISLPAQDTGRFGVVLRVVHGASGDPVDPEEYTFTLYPDENRTFTLPDGTFVFVKVNDVYPGYTLSHDYISVVVTTRSPDGITSIFTGRPEDTGYGLVLNDDYTLEFWDTTRPETNYRALLTVYDDAGFMRDSGTIGLDDEKEIGGYTVRADEVISGLRLNSNYAKLSIELPTGEIKKYLEIGDCVELIE